MALQDIVSVSISLETTGVSQAGFGTPIFIGKHRWFTERVRSYTSLTAAAVDLPAESNEYKAVQGFFANTPSPSLVKVGRRESVAVLTPDAPEEDEVFSFTIVDQEGNEVTASYTALVTDDAEDVATGLKAEIDADINLAANVDATVTGATTTGKLEIDVVASDDSFAISSVSSNLTVSFTSSETAAQTMAAVTAIDDDFYFVTTDDHTETFVLGMADDVEARTKLYFVSNQDAGGVGTLADPATDTLGKLFEGDYFRTVSFFHHTADTAFPECNFVGKGAPYAPGTITWSHKQLGGVGVSRDPSTLSSLSSTQLNNLADRNANFVVSVGGVEITRQGKVVAGEWIDVIRSRDLLVARLTENIQAKLINSLKVPYTDSGINSIRSVVESTLNRYVSTPTRPNILQEVNPFETTFPRSIDVAFNDKALRELTASFKAYLAGAIHIVELSGQLTYSGQ